MLESLSDYLSLLTMILITGVGIYYFIAVSGRHHQSRVRKREEALSRYLEESRDDEEQNDDDLQQE